VLGVTSVIFGKHVDKVVMYREKRIRTLPVLIGEAASRWTIVVFFFASYLITAWLVVTRYLTPSFALVLLAVPALVRELPSFSRPKPAERPKDFPQGEGGWPLYFAPKAFVYTKSFGTWFLAALVLEVALRLIFPDFWR